MTDSQKLKIRWLSRPAQEEKKLLALLSVLKHEEYLLKELEPFQDCSALRQHLQTHQHAIRLQSVKLARMREEIYQAVSSLPDASVQAVCLRKYLAYQTNEQIAEFMFYDVRTIQRKHKIALDALPLPPEFPISETTIFPNISCEN